MSTLLLLPVEPRQGLCRHYKGNEYRVVGLARHSETLEVAAVYDALYGERRRWVRPVAMFMGPWAEPVPFKFLKSSATREWTSYRKSGPLIFGPVSDVNAPFQADEFAVSLVLIGCKAEPKK